MKLLLATGNAHKLTEFRRMFPANQIISPKEVGVSLDVEETGKTFAQNAAIKARELYRLTGIPTISDDSGIVVDALNGFPGVYSARYAPTELCCEKILEELKGVPKEQRGAKFVCSIHFVRSETEEYSVYGECKGYVGFDKAGEHGFGYDPIFYIGDRSTAQMTDAEKDAVSHRGAAFRELQKLFATLGIEV